MRRFIEGTARDQGGLFPAHLEDFIGEDRSDHRSIRCRFRESLFGGLLNRCHNLWQQFYSSG